MLFSFLIAFGNDSKLAQIYIQVTTVVSIFTFVETRCLHARTVGLVELFFVTCSAVFICQ